eukprot:COSAG01_NODE_11175_length_1990_cov_1.129032_1_plen_39_part_10
MRAGSDTSGAGGAAAGARGLPTGERLPGRWAPPPPPPRQ